MDRQRVYYTLDNGGHPFEVVWDYFAETVDIYNNYGVSWDKQSRGPKIASYEMVVRFFAGADPDRNRPEDVGNSVLFTSSEEAPFRYIFVGDSIYAFDLPEEVLYFVSPIGNSSVSYPYAVTKTRTYLFGTNYKVVCLENKELPNLPPTFPEYRALCAFSRYIGRGKTYDPHVWYLSLSEEKRMAIRQPALTVEMICERQIGGRVHEISIPC